MDAGNGQPECSGFGASNEENLETLRVILGLVIGLPAAVCVPCSLSWAVRTGCPGLEKWYVEQERKRRMLDVGEGKKAARERTPSKGELPEDGELEEGELEEGELPVRSDLGRLRRNVGDPSASEKKGDTELAAIPEEQANLPSRYDWWMGRFAGRRGAAPPKKRKDDAADPLAGAAAIGATPADGAKPADEKIHDGVDACDMGDMEEGNMDAFFAPTRKKREADSARGDSSSRGKVQEVVPPMPPPDMPLPPPDAEGSDNLDDFFTPSKHARPSAPPPEPVAGLDEHDNLDNLFHQPLKGKQGQNAPNPESPPTPEAGLGSGQPTSQPTAKSKKPKQTGMPGMPQSAPGRAGAGLPSMPQSNPGRAGADAPSVANRAGQGGLAEGGGDVRTDISEGLDLLFAATRKPADSRSRGGASHTGASRTGASHAGASRAGSSRIGASVASSAMDPPASSSDGSGEEEEESVDENAPIVAAPDFFGYARRVARLPKIGEGEELKDRERDRLLLQDGDISDGSEASKDSLADLPEALLQDLFHPPVD